MILYTIDSYKNGDLFFCNIIKQITDKNGFIINSFPVCGTGSRDHLKVEKFIKKQLEKYYRK